MNTLRRSKLYPLLLVVTLLALLVASGVLADGSIDATDKYAWGTNVGWINFNPSDGGVAVYSDHLEGYAWGENVGWIRLGTHTGGGSYTYTNDAAATYGVNNDGVGNLSGYAWGTNVGWIDFDPTSGGVTIDPVTGDFAGYAWGENVGWIRFQNDSPFYQVNTGWRGDLIATYQNDVAAIIMGRATDPASSGGLILTDNTFLSEAGDGIIFGHNNVAFRGGVIENLPNGVDKRWARIWQLDVNDDQGNGGNVILTFDISEAGGSGEFDSNGTYFLLKRDTGSTGDFVTVTYSDWSVTEDRLSLTVNVSDLGSEFTLGATSGSPTAVGLRRLTPRVEPLTPAITLTSLFVVSMVAVLWWWGRKKDESGLYPQKPGFHVWGTGCNTVLIFGFGLYEILVRTCRSVSVCQTLTGCITWIRIQLERCDLST